MEHRIQLKGTDFKVSPFAFGTVKAGLAWDSADADRIMNTYVEQGGNLIDTARIYYDWEGTEKGRSERVIGDWFRRCKRRNQVVLMTKGGHPPKEAMHISRLSMEDMRYDLEKSLQALGTDHIDIYFYHRDDLKRPVGELLEQMEVFRKEGKILYYGCSNWTTSRMIEADAYAKSHGITGFVANQNLYNIAAQHMKPFEDDTMVCVDEEAIRFYQTSNNTPMPYFSICSGFFHHLAAKGDDAVKNSCYYTPENLKLARGLQTLCKKYGCSITQALLGFFYVQAYPIVPLVGFSKISQLEDALNSVNIPFTQEDYVEIGGIQ